MRVQRGCVDGVVGLGARNSKQLEETIKALAFVDQITSAIKAEIDAVVKFVPKIAQPDMLYTSVGATAEKSPALRFGPPL